MADWLWAVIIVVAVLVVVAVAFAAVRSSRNRRRTHALQDRFGDEYDRKVQETGRRRAETQLSEVAESHDHLDIRPLNSASRQRYMQRWNELQTQFVDQPGHALASADVLVTELMRERGYPVDDFESQADHLALDHPDVVRYYRAAHATQDRAHTGLVNTEEARVAMLQYRALFEALIDQVDAMH